MDARTLTRIRIGIALLVVSGLLTTIGLYMRGPVIDQAADPAGYVQSALDPMHQASWALLLPNLVLQIFCWFALYGLFAGTRYDRLAFWGMVLSIAGNTIFSPAIGVQAFAAPEVARLYAAGNTAVISVVQEGLGSDFVLWFLAGSAPPLFIGSLLFAILFWKSPLFPKWTAPVYFWHSIALTVFVPISYPAEFSGGVCLLLVALALSWAVFKADDPRREAVA